MKKKLGYAIILALFMEPIKCGWPYDGWVAVSSLDAKDAGIQFTAVHQDLAEKECNISNTLEENDKCNIVLATLSVFINGEIKYFPFVASDNRIYVFESGWDSSFKEDPYFKSMETSINKYTTSQKASSDKEELFSKIETIINQKKNFLSLVKQQYYFFDIEPKVDDVLAHIENIFHDVNEDLPGISIYKEFLHNKRVFEKEKESKRELAEGACESCVSLASSLNAETLDEKVLQNISKRALDYIKLIAAKNKDISNIGTKIISTYWHSEQRLLHYIRTHKENIITAILSRYADKSNITQGSIVLHIHSRFDICQVCSHSLVCSYMQPTGILSQFKDAFCQRLGIASDSFKIFVAASFREERKECKHHSDQHITLDKVDLPAFPLLKI